MARGCAAAKRGKGEREISLHIGVREPLCRAHGLEMLRAEAGLLPAGTDLLDDERSVSDKREGQRRAEYLSAAFAL